MDATCLNDALQNEFESTAADRRVVVRQASDLGDAGKAESDRGQELTVDDIVAQLQDAPDGADLVDRWNWWLGALDLAYGGYRQFTVQAVASDPELDT